MTTYPVVNFALILAAAIKARDLPLAVSVGINKIFVEPDVIIIESDESAITKFRGYVRVRSFEVTGTTISYYFGRSIVDHADMNFYPTIENRWDEACEAIMFELKDFN